jgi:hypothetical protein
MSAAFLRLAKPADSPIQRRRDSSKTSDQSQFFKPASIRVAPWATAEFEKS